MVQMMDDRFAGLMKQRHLLALQALAKQAAGFREALPHAFDEQVDVALWQRPRRDAPAHVLDAGKSRFDAPPGLFRADHVFPVIACRGFERRIDGFIRCPVLCIGLELGNGLDHSLGVPEARQPLGGVPQGLILLLEACRAQSWFHEPQ